MITWVKDDQTYVSGPLKYRIGEEEYTALNPTPKFLEELGWTKVVEEVEEPEEVKPDRLPLDRVKNIYAQECESYYRGQVLKFEFADNLEWIDLRDRAAYLTVLSDLEESGWNDSVEYNDIPMSIEEARARLKVLNVYEARCRFILNDHLRHIYSAPNQEALEAYDYTENYPPRPVLV